MNKNTEQLKEAVAVSSTDLLSFLNKRVIHKASTITSLYGESPKWEVDKRDVILMAISGKYAMVRRPRCMPYVASVSEITSG